MKVCSCLYCQSGKKSPVYGKWKEFYFVIKYGDQQLLYFERENVSLNYVLMCVYFIHNMMTES